MPVCPNPECNSYKLEQLNDKWRMACRDCGTTFRLYPVDPAETIHKEALEQIKFVKRAVLAGNFDLTDIEKAEALLNLEETLTFLTKACGVHSKET